jgi:RNA polymerase sigma-70 factor (sigma-E family)
MDDIRAGDRVGPARGPRARWADLFERHAPDALRLAYLLTGDREVAQDLVQDAFVRLFRRLRDLRNPDAFGAYLRRTVVNLSKDHWRRAQVRRRYLRRQRGTPSIQPEPWTEAIEARDELWRALRRLPSAQRATVVLRYYEDLSERQIAEVMGCSVGAVKSRLSRATSALRSQMQEDR